MQQLSLRFVERIPIRKKILKTTIKKYVFKYGAVRIVLKKIPEWSTWIYRLSLNVCLTLLKKKKNSPVRFASDQLPIEVIEDSKTFEDNDLNELYLAIRKLSEIDRAVILLYLEEKSYEEIAHIIGTNANNIGVRIKRIKERLKKLLHGKIN